MTKNEALSKAMKLCSVKEYAPFEVEEKLRDWGVLDTDIADILTTLKEDKFVDEHRMACFYANDKLRFNKWGKIKIRYALQQKKVTAQAISEALNQINTDEYTRILLTELRKKAKTIKETDPYRFKAKLFQFAASRGFEAEVIYKLMDNEV